MSWVEYTYKRFVEAIPTLFGLSVLIFAITRVVPGDPVRLALGPKANQEQVRQLREQMGLDEPLWVQYINWITGVFNGEWGISLRTDQNVLIDLAPRFPATLELALAALLIAVVLSVPFGVIAATNKDHWPDHLSRLAALTGVSMPRFYVGILLQFALVIHLGLLPLGGRLSGTAPPHMTGLYTIDSLAAGQWGTFIDAVKHLFLPAFTLGLATLAQVMRLIRSEMIDESRKDYVLASRAYGLPRNLITYKYMLKNAFSSSLTIIGLAFGLLIGGAFVVEIVFFWPGMAKYGVDAILFNDFNAVVAVVMIVGVTYLAANFVVDLVYGYLDPRIRHGGEE